MSTTLKLTTINPRVTKLLYAQILLCYLVNHMDLGIISVSATEILNDLNISKSDLGLLESALYMGNIIGSFLSPLMFRKFHPKVLIVIASIANSTFLLPFTFTTNYWAIFSTRILTGVF